MTKRLPGMEVGANVLWWIFPTFRDWNCALLSLLHVIITCFNNTWLIEQAHRTT